MNGERSEVSTKQMVGDESEEEQVMTEVSKDSWLTENRGERRTNSFTGKGVADCEVTQMVEHGKSNEDALNPLSDK